MNFFCKFNFSYEISYEIFGNKETLIIGMDHINLLLITSITHIKSGNNCLVKKIILEKN